MTAREKNRQPGRPREFEPDAIIDRAVDLFWSKGYRATTTRDLEESLGLSQSSIYNSFGSKQELLKKALSRYEEMANESLLGPLRQSPDGLPAIETFFGSLKKWVSGDKRRGCFLTNLMVEDSGITRSVRQRSDAYREGLRVELESALQRALDNKEMAPDADIRSRSTLLVGMALGLNVAARGGISDEEISSISDAIQAEVRSWRK